MDESDPPTDLSANYEPFEEMFEEFLDGSHPPPVKILTIFYTIEGTCWEDELGLCREVIIDDYEMVDSDSEFEEFVGNPPQRINIQEPKSMIDVAACVEDFRCRVISEGIQEAKNDEAKILIFTEYAGFTPSEHCMCNIYWICEDEFSEQCDNHAYCPDECNGYCCEDACGHQHAKGPTRPHVLSSDVAFTSPYPFGCCKERYRRSHTHTKECKKWVKEQARLERETQEKWARTREKEAKEREKLELIREFRREGERKEAANQKIRQRFKENPRPPRAG